MGRSLKERLKNAGKSPFECTNKELADSRFCSDVHFKSEEEKEYFFSLDDSIDTDEQRRLEIGMEKFGYDNVDKLRRLSAYKDR